MINHTRTLILCFLSVGIIYSCQNANADSKSPVSSKNAASKKVEYAMVIHGGAGTILKKNMTPEKEAAYTEVLKDALQKGKSILANGGSSKDAVIQTIELMENSPLFNAGKGAVFTNDGTNKLDASIMDGATLDAGAVGGIGLVKNPIKAANAVMENSEHVLLSGAGAEAFCKTQNLEIVDPKYFFTEKRWQSLQRALDKENGMGNIFESNPDYKFGTVGAVALDKEGNIVAGTSTGGMTNKRFDRIGDSPIIGAGTYADNQTCGVSCTGHGEYFIRYAVAHDVSAQLEYSNKSLDEAANYTINEKLVEAGGSGGLIALDKKGNISMPFNTEGMYRGYITDKEQYIGIYKND
ncbi:MAG: isoaspartyl peptidase/L-asparaginase [Bacteroidia bacterium]|nr:isoaspartyl peptidase/L-asparaginase [Bacteroidia bacterium]